MPFTPRQVSEMLKIPLPSIRRLALEFKDNLSQYPGVHRRYSQSDIDTLRRIRALTTSGKTIAEIHNLLPIMEQDQLRVSDSLDLVPEIVQRFEIIENTHRQEIARLDQQLQESAFRLDQLEKDHARLEQEHADLAAQVAAWNNLPWYKRLFRQPPDTR